MTQHACWACSRVGWTIPVTDAKTNSFRIDMSSKHTELTRVNTCSDFLIGPVVEINGLVDALR